MGESPGQLNPATLKRAGIIGAILGVLAIILFVGIWIVLSSLEVDVFIRLIVAMCIPPAIISMILGLFMLAARQRHQRASHPDE